MEPHLANKQIALEKSEVVFEFPLDPHVRVPSWMLAQPTMDSPSPAATAHLDAFCCEMGTSYNGARIKPRLFAW